MGPFATSFLASLGAGLATGIGALPALFFSKASDRLLDAMLGFAGGVMIAASMFGLLVPAFRLGGIPVVVLGSIIGVLFLDRANLLIPHLHRLRGAEGPSASLRRAWLVLLAMVIHNIPEGLAVGVSFGQDESASGPMLAFGIGLQNLPEGLLPIGLAFASGAMLYVVFQEIIPESHRRGFQREATFSTLLGIIFMVSLAYSASL